MASHAMKRILALVDFSDAMPEVVSMAGRLARAFEATVYIVHVVDPAPESKGDELRKDISRIGLAREMRRKRRALQIAATALKKLGVHSIALLVAGPPARKALQQMTRRQPDLIVVGRHDHGRLYQFLSGGVGAAVARRSDCPVLVVPSPKTAQPASVAEVAQG